MNKVLFVALSILFTSQVMAQNVIEKGKKLDNILLDGKVITIEDAIQEVGLPSLTIAVFENYEIIWTEQWGVKDLISNEPINELTSFSTASISKAITATLVVILEEKGMIELTIPVNDYLKRWKIPDNEYTRNTPVTLEHLLSHTAGTTQHGFTDFYEGEDIPTIFESVKGEIPSYNKPIEVNFEPGTNWRYSGGGYTIIQMALEDHLGKPLADLIETHLFSPLGMKNSTMKQPNETGFLDNVAKAHDEEGNIISTGIPITPQLAASGLWSNPIDMAIFLIEIQKALNGQKTLVISQNVAKRVTDIVTIKTVGGWSLGWERIIGAGNREWFSHGGSNTGTGGHIYATMQGGNGIAMFGNGPNSIRIPVLDAFLNEVIKEFGWEAPLKDEMVKPITIEKLKEFTGKYLDVSFGAVINVELNDMNLHISPYFNQDILHIGDQTFILPNLPNRLKFTKHPTDGEFYIAFVRDGVSEITYPFRRINGKFPLDYIAEGNYKEAKKAFQNEKEKFPNSPIVSESNINRLGYDQIRDGNLESAIEIFKINVEFYPESANVYDSLGEAFLELGMKEEALINYKKAYSLNPENTNAKKIIDQIELDSKSKNE